MRRLTVLLMLVGTTALAGGTADTTLNGTEPAKAELTCQMTSAEVESKDALSICEAKSSSDGATTLAGCSCGNGYYCNGMYLEYRAACSLSCCVYSKTYCARGCVNQPCGVPDYCL